MIRDARKVHGLTPSQRFWIKVEGGDVSTCWEWRARIEATGYGRFAIDPSRPILAHRFAYEDMVGAIPEGLQLDHVCRNRTCVNPWHLEPVTSLVNVRRSTNCRATDEECANGHPWTAETEFHEGGRRRCRACRRDAGRRYRDRLAVAA